MSADVTFEVNTIMEKRKIKAHLSGLWHGEGIEVGEAISKGMSCLAILSYYFRSEAMKRPGQDE